MYRTLNPAKVIQTLDRLHKRIDERFPSAGLARVCAELGQIAREHSARADQIGRQNWALRAGVATLMVAGLTLLITIAWHIDFSKTSADSVFTVLQGIEAAMNVLVLMGAAALFLVSFETRVKRRRALTALHELRSIVHVIDMHQLTKDPSTLVALGHATPSSPQRHLTPYELTRYLDYCAEMLSLAAKLAVLYAQNCPDPVVTDAVSDVEHITANLSQKIWQKITLIEELAGTGSAPGVHALTAQKPTAPPAQPS
jgi:hypothetical protein